jgi:murein DD-endopeptidase MepM/ murein hydrolase activator NlpD
MRLRPLVLLLAPALVVGAGPAASSWAKTSTPNDGTAKTAKDKRAAELRDLMGVATQEEGDLLAQIADIQERLDVLSDTVRRYSRDAAVAGRRLAKSQRDLDKAEAKRAELAQHLVEAQAQIDASRKAVNETVVAFYTRGQSDEQAIYAAVVQGSTSPRDVFAATHYLNGMLRADRIVLERFIALKAEVEVLTREVAAQVEEARVARDALAAERDRVEGLRQQAVEARAAAKAEEDHQHDLLKEVENRKADFQRELGLLQAESSAIGEWLRSLQAGQKLARRHKGTFKTPVRAPMTSGFGPRVHPIFGDVRMHTGVDFGAGMGDPIRAAGGGIVVWAGPRGGYGNLVAIDHGNGLATLYAHQSRLDVTIGQRVKTGQVVGAVGSTGLSSGPHLHFETRELGTPVDPTLYL